MENGLKIDVGTLDAPHRRAIEEVIGRELATNQRILISIVESDAPPIDTTRPIQSLDDWTHVYDDLSSEDIEAIDQVIKMRADLTRNPP
jgi:hypothetical protein